MKRRKGRAKRGARNRYAVEPEELKNAPHTFVFQRGSKCTQIRLLLKDIRKMLEPFTATNLRVTRRNVLRDLTTVAGIFHVTHLWILSRSPRHLYLRLAALPAGPTLKFFITHFASMHDVRASMRRPISDQGYYYSAPLLVISGMNKQDKKAKLISTVFQRCLPAMNVNNVKLSNVRRCMLLHQVSDGHYQIRHYAVRCSLTKQINKAVRRLLDNKSLPDLSTCSDVSEYFYRPSMSDTEEDEPVELPQDINSIHTKGSQSSIRLVEMGPRLDLQLARIEDKVCEGNKLWPPPRSEKPEATTECPDE